MCVPACLLACMCMCTHLKGRETHATLSSSSLLRKMKEFFEHLANLKHGRVNSDANSRSSRREGALGSWLPIGLRYPRSYAWWVQSHGRNHRRGRHSDRSALGSSQAGNGRCGAFVHTSSPLRLFRTYPGSSSLVPCLRACVHVIMCAREC